MEMQIKLVATGYCDSIEDYMLSDGFRSDNVGYIVDRDGSVTNCKDTNVIALVNAGPVVQRDNQWIPATMGSNGKYIPIVGAVPVRVPYEYCSCSKYHGCQHYEMMSMKQIRALRHQIVLMMTKNNMTYLYDNQLGDVCPRAIAGKSGIFFASSYDKSRSDVHPQVELINLIKSLAI